MAESTIEELLGKCQRAAVHLEMRDTYTPDDQVFIDWKAGATVDPVEAWRDWYDLVEATVARGVQMGCR